MTQQGGALVLPGYAGGAALVHAGAALVEEAHGAGPVVREVLAALRGLAQLHAVRLVALERDQDVLAHALAYTDVEGKTLSELQTPLLALINYPSLCVLYIHLAPFY